MSGQKSVFFKDTGKIDGDGRVIKETVFLSSRDTARLSLYDKGDKQNGLALRVNSAAASPQDATGYQILMDTMTYIKQQESAQVYYDLMGKKPSDYVPIAVGDGAWAADILTRRTYGNSGDFEASLTRQGSHGARKTNSTVSMDAVTIPTFIFEDGVEYNIPEIEQALVASNWDIIAGKHKVRMEKWQLGLQRLAFLGTRSGGMQGLLNNTQTNINTTFITAPISGYNQASFTAFVAGLMALYFANTNSTKLPTHFVMPMVDWLGLQTPVPGTVTLLPMIKYLEMAFEAICGPSFKILPVAYGDPANSFGSLHTYALYRYDAESIRMDIPVDLTITQPNSLDNYNFQDVAYGQMTGMGFYRPLETLLFQY